MNPNEIELWKALDYEVFESNGLEDSLEGMDRAKAQYSKERSSLGRYLTSLREFDELSVEEMAEKAGVSPSVWRQWEFDYATPSREELQRVGDCLHWRSRKRDIAGSLREQAPRYRLKRLSGFSPELLAARGELDSGGVAWNSIDEATQRRVYEWGVVHGYTFPEGLVDFFRDFGDDDEAREAWLDEILGPGLSGTDPV